MRHHFSHHEYVTLPFLFLLTLVSLGCGQSGPAVQYVRGVITLDGAPLEGATVLFSPKSTGGLGAAGKTQADGSFTLNAQGAQPGAGTTIGDYAVTVSKIEMPEFVEIDEDDPRYGTPEQDRIQQEASNAKPKVIVPEKYNNSETSPFTAQIVSGKNEFTFDVSSKSN